jgi:hypothetical protein
MQKPLESSTIFEPVVIVARLLFLFRFTGSHSSAYTALLAAKLAGRRFLGIELDDRYFRRAAVRLSCRAA